MSRLFRGMLRGLCLVAFLVCLAAIGLGRYAPQVAGFRVFKPNRLEIVNGYHFASTPHLPRFFDPGTGEFARLDFAGDDYVDCAAFSSWEDEEGRSQVIGRWVHRSTESGVCEGYGLGRYRIP